MQVTDIKTIPFYIFQNLQQYDELIHFVSTRDGGTSEGTYSSLNLTCRVNDNPDNVKRNRELIAQIFDVNPRNLIFSGQTHEDKVAVIDKALLEKSEEEQNQQLHGVDAMITNLSIICLCILTADCASVILYDPVVRAIGIAHAGWKGTVKKIAAKTFEAMQLHYGSRAENITAAIGPCISGNSFEVGEEVAEAFNKTFHGNNNIVIRKHEWAKPHVDIVNANMEVLKSCGIKSANIEKSGICTFQNQDIFFSARRNDGGRFCTGAMMR